MWHCPKCHETVDQGFDTCWQCGTSREGIVDTEFRKADEITPADMEPVSSLDVNKPETSIKIPDNRPSPQTLPMATRAILTFTRIVLGMIFGGVAGFLLGLAFTYMVVADAKRRHPDDPSAGSAAIIGCAALPLGMLGGSAVGIAIASALSHRLNSRARTSTGQAGESPR